MSAPARQHHADGECTPHRQRIDAGQPGRHQNGRWHEQRGRFEDPNACGSELESQRQAVEPQQHATRHEDREPRAHRQQFAQERRGLEDQADALYRALTMPPEERRRRATALAAYVRAHDIEAWIQGQLADIERLAGTVPNL